MKRVLTKKSTTYFIVLGLLTLFATALPFQYLSGSYVPLFTAMFGTQSLQPLTFINTISGHVSGGGTGYIITQILCWSIIIFLFASLINSIINLTLLFNPHNLLLIAFRNFYAYFFLSISIFAATTISVWALSTLMNYGINTVISFGIGLSILSLLAIAQASVCSTCLKTSNVKIELNAYEKTIQTSI